MTVQIGPFINEIDVGNVRLQQFLIVCVDKKKRGMFEGWQWRSSNSYVLPMGIIMVVPFRRDVDVAFLSFD